MSRRGGVCVAIASLVALASAQPAGATITVTQRLAQLEVFDLACINSSTACVKNPPTQNDVASAPAGTGPFTLDHTFTEPHASVASGGDEAHADASGHYTASMTGGGASDLVVTATGSVSSSAGITTVSGHSNVAEGLADGVTSMSFTLDSPVSYQFAGTSHLVGNENLNPARLVHADPTNTAVVFTMGQEGALSGSATGTLTPGKYTYVDFGHALAYESSSFKPGNAASQTWSTKLTLKGASCPDVHVGNAVAQGCFTETAAGTGVFETDKRAWVGGFEVLPRGGGKLVIDTKNATVSSGGSGTDILLDGFVAPFGAEQLPVKFTDFTFDLNQAGTIEKLLDLPVKGKIKVAWASGGTAASLDAELSLSSMTSPLGKLVTLGTGAGEADAKISLKLANGTGLIVSSAEAKIDEVSVIPSIFKVSRALALKNVLLRFELKDGKPFWTGQAFISIPFKQGPLELGGKVFAFDGSFAGGGLALDGIDKEIPDTPLFLQRIGGDLIFRPDWGVTVDVGTTLGPRVDGKQIFTIDGSLTSGALVSSSDCKNGLDPSKLEGKVKIKELEKFPGTKVEGTMRSCLYAGPIVAQDATIQGKISFANGAIGYEGSQSGFVGRTGFDLEGSVLLRLPALPDFAGQAIMSNQGIAACGTVGFFQGGFGYRWGQSAPTTFSGCDLSPFRTTAISARATGRASATTRQFRVPAGLPHVAFAARSDAGAPRIRVSGPGGVTFTSPAQGAVRSHRVVVVPVAFEHTTYVIVNDPAAGRWFVRSLDPSQVLTSVAIAAGLPKPQVSARLATRGAVRVLSYRVKTLPGQTVTFVERAAGGVGHVLGRARGRSGQITFRATVAKASAHAILAQVVQNGMPRAELKVARFSAGPPKLRKPIVKAKRVGHALTVSWRRVSGAQHYLVEVAAGGSVLARVLTIGTRLTISAPGGALIVSVQPMSDLTGPGPASHAQLKAAG